MIIKYKFGFWYKNWLFVWHKKELFRYPIERNNRYYSLKKVTVDTNRSSKENYYRCACDWLPKTRLEDITISVNVKPLEFIKDNDLPF